ncbi:Lipid kinase YegS [compost metagenome]
MKNLLTEGFGIDSMFVRARLPWIEIKVSEGLYINLDGEPLEGDNLRFAVRPAALLVHMPEKSPLLRASEVPSHQG